MRLLRHRSSLILTDQAISSISNFAVILCVGRWLGPGQLGVVALVLSMWVIGYGIFRATVADPMVVIGEPRGLGEYVSATLVTSLAGMSVLVLAALASAATSHSYSETLALAVSLPFLLLQDLWRRVAYMHRAPVQAVLNDLAYLVVQVAALVALRESGAFSAWGAIACWGLGAAAGAAMGFAQFRPDLAGLRAGVRMLSRARGMSGWLVLDFGVNRWARQAVLFVIAAVTGTAAVGAIQASASLLGFTNILVLGWSSEALAEGAAASRGGDHTEMLGRVRRSSLFLAATMATACGLFAAFAFKILPAVYGRGYGSYTHVAPIVALGTFVAAMDLFPVTVLRIVQRTRRMFAARLMLTPLGLLAAWPLAAAGLVGGAWATVVMAVALTAGAWLGVVSRTPSGAPLNRSSASDPL